MKSKLSFLLIALLNIIITGEFIMPQTQNKNKTDDVIITVIYDNNQFQNGLTTDWGFACLAEVGKTKILFDTGDNGSILLNNMAKLNIDPEGIDIVVLSHFHHDHTGGLNDFLKRNSKVTIYYPQSFPNELIEKIKESGAKYFPVSSFREIIPNVFSLGEMGEAIPEQSMVIRSPNGLVVITGCAHPGITNILQKTIDQLPNETIYLALGGFHLHRLNEEDINEFIQIISFLEIHTISPTHCSGNTTRKMFEDVYGADYLNVGAGKKIDIRKGVN
ncbi:MAG: MBL fold metallo-hydrolase, partial [Ignavibacteriaceae bacterium]